MKRTTLNGDLFVFSILYVKKTVYMKYSFFVPGWEFECIFGGAVSKL